MYLTCASTLIPASCTGGPLAGACSIAVKIQQARKREPPARYCNIPAFWHACMPIHLHPTSDGRGQGGMRADEANWSRYFSPTRTAVVAMDVMIGVVGVGQFDSINVAEQVLGEIPAWLAIKPAKSLLFLGSSSAYPSSVRLELPHQQLPVPPTSLQHKHP